MGDAKIECIGAGAGHRDLDAADADAHQGADFEEPQANGAAGRTGEPGARESDPPQGVDQHIGEGREPQPELIGGHGGRRRAVGEEIELLLLDTVFHVAPRTVDPLVQPAAADLIRVQGGNDEARIGSFRQVLGLGHHPAAPAPALAASGKRTP